jgi:hypothetical protein
LNIGGFSIGGGGEKMVDWWNINFVGMLVAITG